MNKVKKIPKAVFFMQGLQSLKNEQINYISKISSGQESMNKGKDFFSRNSAHGKKRVCGQLKRAISD
jgi:hypothetical protein